MTLEEIAKEIGVSKSTVSRAPVSYTHLPYGKSDYIPCICWGRNARYASAFAVGGHVLIWGRIQSREYMKRLSETEMEKRTAYEVSVSKLEYSES